MVPSRRSTWFQRRLRNLLLAHAGVEGEDQDRLQRGLRCSVQLEKRLLVDDHVAHVGFVKQLQAEKRIGRETPALDAVVADAGLPRVRLTRWTQGFRQHREQMLSEQRRNEERRKQDDCYKDSRRISRREVLEAHDAVSEARKEEERASQWKGGSEEAEDLKSREGQLAFFDDLIAGGASLSNTVARSPFAWEAVARRAT